MAGYWPSSHIHLVHAKKRQTNIQPYYIASYMSGQDESNPVL